MELLPLELHLHHIFIHIDIPTIVRSKRVSKDWKDLIERVLPNLEIDLSDNEYISDEDLGVFSKNKNINLSNCFNLTGSTMWWIWADKLNIEGCINLGDCVFKYLGGVKELNIRDAYDFNGHRIKTTYFDKLEKLIVSPKYGNSEFEMSAPNLTTLIIQDFMIGSKLFYRHQKLKGIQFINCAFNADFYYSLNKEYCQNIMSVVFNDSCDTVYSDDYDETHANIISFIKDYLPETCIISYHGNLIDKQINVDNLTKQDFIDLIN